MTNGCSGWHALASDSHYTVLLERRKTGVGLSCKKPIRQMTTELLECGF